MASEDTLEQETPGLMARSKVTGLQGLLTACATVIWAHDTMIPPFTDGARRRAGGGRWASKVLRESLCLPAWKRGSPET